MDALCFLDGGFPEFGELLEIGSFVQNAGLELQEEG